MLDADTETTDSVPFSLSFSFSSAPVALYSPSPTPLSFLFPFFPVISLIFRVAWCKGKCDRHQKRGMGVNKTNKRTGGEKASTYQAELYGMDGCGREGRVARPSHLTLTPPSLLSTAQRLRARARTVRPASRRS